jgi:hypothetical protein
MAFAATPARLLGFLHVEQFQFGCVEFGMQRTGELGWSDGSMAFWAAWFRGRAHTTDSTARREAKCGIRRAFVSMSLAAALALLVVDLPTVLLNHGVQLVVIALKAVQRGCLVAERDVWP